MYLNGIFETFSVLTYSVLYLISCFSFSFHLHPASIFKPTTATTIFKTNEHTHTHQLECTQKIQSESNFDYIKSLIPNVMLSLRHIWTISKYFSQDEKMQMLLYKISFIFTEKVKRIVTLNAIFKYSASDAHALATKCADLLLTWKENYLKTRAHIEQSGVGSRWEFNKNILFDDVDHCARISNDIANISLVFIEFENIFKQKLQSLVYNPDDVDNMMNKVSGAKTIYMWLCSERTVLTKKRYSRYARES